MRILTLLIALFISSQAGSQTIRIDGDYSDWSNINPAFTDNLNDGQSNGIDFENIWVYNDQSNIYFRFQLNKEIDLQEDNELAIYIDYDNDINTGFKINGIGAELRFLFGDRLGIISTNGETEFISFDAVNLLVAPSVTSTEFEVSFSREISEYGLNFEAEENITFRLEDNGFNGDEAPNDLSGIDYTIDESIMSETPAIDLERKSNTDFRFMTYNIENDQLFDGSRKNAFRRIFQATNPDIIAFQEIRDFSSSQTRALIAEFLPGTWYHQKHGFDIVTVSRYPINFSENINGNAAYYLDVDGKEILMINCHLPCCDNDNDRQSEVDGIMEYIREARSGNSNYKLNDGTPIIVAGDMNFVGDREQPNTFLTGDIFSNGSYGPDFNPDWDGTDFSDADPSATGTISNFTWINRFGSFFAGKLDWVVYSDSQMKLLNTYALWTEGMSFGELEANDLNSFDVVFAADHLPVVTDFNFSTVSTEEFIELDINIYPNPVRDIIYMTTEEKLTEDILVFNINGEKVKSLKADKTKIQIFEVDDLPNGQYYMIFKSDKGRMVKKISKL